MTGLLNGFAAVILAVFSTAAVAAPISYDLIPFDIDVAGSNPGSFFDGSFSVTGSIKTDGTIGPISAANILSASATATRAGDGASTSIVYNPLDFGHAIVVRDVMITATLTDILLNFASGGSILFSQPSPINPAISNTFGYREDSVTAFVQFPVLAINAEKQIASGSSATIATVADVSPVPLPPALGFLAAGFAMFGLVGRRRAARCFVPTELGDGASLTQ